MLQADVALVVTDTAQDRRFTGNDLVAGPPVIGFYAGYPLRTPTGAVLGTLSVLGFEPRAGGLAPAQERLLTLLAAQVTRQVELANTLAQRDALIQDLQERNAEQAAAHESLRRSEHRFRVLFDSNPVGQVELSAAGVVQHVNSAFAALVGVPDRDLLLGRTPDWATSSDERPAQARTVEEAATAPGQVLPTERTIVRPDGTPVEIDGTLVGVLGPDGEATVLIGSVVDVTMRNAAQRRLVELADELAAARDEALRRNALTETVLATVAVGIVACDAEGRLTMFNRAAREFLALDLDAAADLSDVVAAHPLLAEDGVTLLRAEQRPLFRALHEGTVDDVAVVIARQGLAPRLVRCDGRAMRDQSGRLLGAVLVMTDISQARRAARELAAQAEFTRVLLDSAHTAIWSCDTAGRPTFVNASACAVLGWPDLPALVGLYDSGELASLGGGVEMLDARGNPLAPEHRPLHRALSGQHTGEIEVVLAAEGRARRTMLLQASPLRDGDGRVDGAVLTGHDVTDLRESEARFRAAFHDGPTPVARLDPHGIIREVNPALRRLTGLRSAALLGRPLLDHVHPDV